jgi:hypothetical protein
VGSTGLTGVRRCSPKSSNRRARVGIARLASRRSKFAVAGHLSDGAKTKISEFALEGHVVIGEGYTEFAGFPVVHQKITGFLG